MTEVYPATVGTIVRQYLREHGYDGLAGEHCGCSIEDFPPCEHISPDCVGAYVRKATQEDVDELDADLEVGDLIYSPIKER